MTEPDRSNAATPANHSVDILNLPNQGIRIRRMSTNPPVTPQTQENIENGIESRDMAENRRRSFSAPQRYVQQSPEFGDLYRTNTTQTERMATIAEGPHPRPETPTRRYARVPPRRPVGSSPGQKRYRTAGTDNYHAHPRYKPGQNEYGSDVVGLLDLVDPEVQTIGTLTNVQNSLFVPDLGGWINRRPTYQLTQKPHDLESGSVSRRLSSRLSHRPTSGTDIEMRSPKPRTGRAPSIDSRLSESRYAVLPHGVNLNDWPEEDIEFLDDHVRHLLHSRREGFKRKMRGLKKYVSQPLGLFVFVYAVLVTLFGTAWVFCLIGWIYIGDRQDYFINVIDLTLVALFALMGDGLAPFRAVDTYHMCFIAHYHHLTWKRRKERQLPDLVDHNDLPDRRPDSLLQQEDQNDSAEFTVLSPRQQRRLRYHQAKFSKAHTFYKPHETATHHAFPLRLLVAIVVLLDFHSLFQIALGTCTWSIDYHVRPEALTATILSCSLACNITGGVLISIGDRRTRKKEVLERIFRQGLTEEAIKHVEQRRKTMEAERTELPET